MANDADELVVLREVSTRSEADLIEALLKGAGIPCIVSAPSVYAHLPLSEAITIRVLARDLPRAEAAIAEPEGAGFEGAEATREEDFCPFCGGYLGEARQLCPHCGRDISEWTAVHEEPPAQPVPAHMREHSTTWRFLVLLALGAAAVMVFTPWGRQVGAMLLRRMLELTRHVPMQTL
jgi:hypothetical protein